MHGWVVLPENGHYLFRDFTIARHMEVDQNKVRTEFQGDVALARLARVEYEPHWSYRASQSARHTFEPHRMQYIVRHALPT
jgi:hypothetical protein